MGDMTQTMSSEIGSLVTALAKAQASLKPAIKDATNPFFKSNYADLSSIWEAARAPLAENQLAVIQTTEGEGEILKVVTTLAHSSGQWIRGSLAMKPVKNDPQGIGSAITYARRYSLAAIVGICQEDDDAEGAMYRKSDKNEKLNGSKFEGFPKETSPDTVHGSYQFISPAQGKRLYAIYKSKGLTDNQVRDYLRETYGIQKSSEIPSKDYETIVNWVQSYDPSKILADEEERIPGLDG